MSKFFVNSEQICNKEIEIIGGDVNHIKNVLRAKVDEVINICNSDSCQDYKCKIISINKDCVKCEIIEEMENNVESNVFVSIFQGLPKSDKMELIIQKSVELGVYDITPVEMKRCIVKFNNKDKEKKISRWQKISEVAAKQCGRNIIPKINNVINVKNICNLCNKYDIVIVAYEQEKNNTLKDELVKLKKIKGKVPSQNLKKLDDNEIFLKEIKIAVVIGPEGGFEESEIEILKKAGMKIVTLGKRILRTETVALNMISSIMYEFN